MAENPINNNLKVTLPYAEELTKYSSQILLSVHCIEANAALEKGLRSQIEENKKQFADLKISNAILENQKRHDEQNKKSWSATVDSSRPRILDIKEQYLLAKENKKNMIEHLNDKIKKNEEDWLVVTNRWQKIPFIKQYLDTNNKIEAVRANIDSLEIDREKLRHDIALKKAELFDKDKKKIVELANFMINERPVLLKRIHEKTNQMKKLENERQINNLLMIEAKKNYIEDISRNNAYDNYFGLPKLRLLNMEYSPIKFDQVQKVDYTNTASNKRPRESYVSEKYDKRQKANAAEKIDEFDALIYFTSSKNIDENNSKKYSDKKLIHILQDVKLDTAGAYRIVSRLNPSQCQDVNVIKARESQHDLKENEPPQDTVNEQITEVIKIDLTKEVSQDVILPPTQFMDITRNSQEKRVTFNTTVEDIPNLVGDGDDVTPQDDDNTLNASAASDDSYKKMKDFMFKKHNLNVSPVFTYTKNTVVPMVPQKKIVTSKFFDKNQEEGNANTDSTQEQRENIKIVDDERRNTEQEINKTPVETIKQHNSISGSQFEVQECTQVDVPSFPRYLQTGPDAHDISINTSTGCEDTEYPQCIDSTLLMSPKADDEMQTKNDDAPPQEMPNFMSGFRKTGLSIFGKSSSANKPDAQSGDNNFNFTFGGNGKPKRGGFFNLFQ